MSSRAPTLALRRVVDILSQPYLSYPPGKSAKILSRAIAPSSEDLVSINDFNRFRDFAAFGLALVESAYRNFSPLTLVITLNRRAHNSPHARGFVAMLARLDLPFDVEPKSQGFLAFAVIAPCLAPFITLRVTLD